MNMNVCGMSEDGKNEWIKQSMFLLLKVMPSICQSSRKKWRSCALPIKFGGFLSSELQRGIRVTLKCQNWWRSGAFISRALKNLDLGLILQI